MLKSEEKKTGFANEDGQASSHPSQVYNENKSAPKRVFYASHSPFFVYIFHT